MTTTTQAAEATKFRIRIAADQVSRQSSDGKFYCGGTFKSRAAAEKMLARYGSHPAYDITGWKVVET